MWIAERSKSALHGHRTVPKDVASEILPMVLIRCQLSEPATQAWKVRKLCKKARLDPCSCMDLYEARVRPGNSSL